MSVNLWNPNNLEVHCEYCCCPLEIWEKSPKALTTYSGDEGQKKNRVKRGPYRRFWGCRDQ